MGDCSSTASMGDGIYLQCEGTRHHVDFAELIG